VLRDGRHVLLVAGRNAGAAAPAALDGCAGLVTVVDGHLPGAAGRGSFALVRPDGFLAARGTRRDAGRLGEYLHRLGAPAVPA
jgi:hypothetical protein